MKALTKGQFAEIVYHSRSKKETTRRTIIATTVPAKIVKAIDVTALSEKEALEMQKMYEEYNEYYENFAANAFNFETWAEHAKGKTISPKWRALLPANILDVR